MNKRIYLALIISAVVVGGLVGTTLLSHTQIVKAASVDFFLKIDGIDGASTDSSHAGAIEVDSWSFGASNAAVNNGGGGLGSGVGKVSRKGLTITKRIDKASPMLYNAQTSAKHVKNATLTVNIMGTQQFLTIKMTDVLISSYTISGGQGEAPMETVSFNFTKIEMGYPK